MTPAAVERGAVASSLRPAVGRRCSFASAEVEHLDVAVVGDHHVVGLEIAVHDAGRMRRGQRVARLREIVERPLQVEAAAARARRAASRRHQLHGDVVDGVGADLVDRRQVRMIERRCGPRFLDEALDARRVAGQLGRQDLDGEIAAERRVTGAIDLTHASRANPGDDLVAAELRSDHAGLYLSVLLLDSVTGD